MKLDPNTILTGALMVLTVFNVGPLLLKLVPSNKEQKESKKVAADTESVSVTTATAVVSMLKQELADKVSEIERIKEEFQKLLKQVVEIERREDQFDIFAEAMVVWASAAYSVILETHPDFDFPPLHLLEEYKNAKAASKSDASQSSDGTGSGPDRVGND